MRIYRTSVECSFIPGIKITRPFIQRLVKAYLVVISIRCNIFFPFVTADLQPSGGRFHEFSGSPFSSQRSMMITERCSVSRGKQHVFLIQRDFFILFEVRNFDSVQQFPYCLPNEQQREFQISRAKRSIRSYRWSVKHFSPFGEIRKNCFAELPTRNRINRRFGGKLCPR